MKNLSIDSKIYAAKLMEQLETHGLIRDLLETEDISLVEEFKEMLTEEIHIQAYKNEIEFGDHVLTVDQLDLVINKCIVQENLDALEKEGLVEKDFSPEEMDTIYKLTEKGKMLRDDI